MSIYDKKFIHVDSEQISVSGMLWGLLELGIDLNRGQEKTDIFSNSEDMTHRMMAEIAGYDVVTSQNFIPAVAEACHRLNKPYISWIYDCPQISLFREEARYGTNFIFMFDREGTDMLRKKGIPHVYHRPLAANTSQIACVDIEAEHLEKYECDVSFVGSLYIKDYMAGELSSMPDKHRRELDDYVSRNLCVFDGREHYVPGFSDEFVDYAFSRVNRSGLENNSIDKEYLVELLLGIPLMAKSERITLINKAAEKYDTRLYTREKDTSAIKAQVCDGVDYDTDMYRVFYASRINLNITWRGIVTGIPQRIFDICAAGGFALSNYQPELTEYFEIGRELETFSDIQEYEEKLDYYLHNERERLDVATRGYMKVNQLYNYRTVMQSILDIVDREANII